MLSLSEPTSHSAHFALHSVKSTLMRDGQDREGRSPIGLRHRYRSFFALKAQTGLDLPVSRCTASCRDVMRIVSLGALINGSQRVERFLVETTQPKSNPAVCLLTVREQPKADGSKIFRFTERSRTMGTIRGGTGIARGNMRYVREDMGLVRGDRAAKLAMAALKYRSHISTPMSLTKDNRHYLFLQLVSSS